MSTLSELKKDAEKKWKVFLKEETEALVRGTENSFLPWRHKGVKIELTGSLAEISRDIQELQKWCKDNTGKGYRLEWKTSVTRKYNSQSSVESIYVETAEDFAYLNGREREYSRFCASVNLLKGYFIKNGYSTDNLLKYLENGRTLTLLQEDNGKGYWQGIIRCLDWLVKNPGSGYFVRQVPAETGTKFIESNSEVIKALFCAVNGIENTDKTLIELTGLREYVPPVYYRVKSPIPEVGTEEQCLSLRCFAQYDVLMDHTQLNKSIRRVVVIENHKTFLTFPVTDRTMVIWGGGCSANTRLKGCEWLKKKELYYWGDIDEHGYGILYRFRNDYPNAESFLMDRETFMDHLEEAVSVDISDRFSEIREANFNEEEAGMLKWLKEQREKGKKNRLEQELISDSYIEREWVSRTE